MCICVCLDDWFVGKGIFEGKCRYVYVCAYVCVYGVRVEVTSVKVCIYV